MRAGSDENITDRVANYDPVFIPPIFFNLKISLLQNGRNKNRISFLRASTTYSSPQLQTPSGRRDQAARYGKQLGLAEIPLIFFVEHIDDTNREKYEKAHTDEESGVRVTPIFVDTGN